jgi:hypothetical protein
MSEPEPKDYASRHEDIADAILVIVSEFGTDRWWKKSESGQLLLDWVSAYWPDKVVAHAHITEPEQRTHP